MPEFRISLTVEAQQAIEQTKAFIAEATSSIEKRYADATEKAGAKINELAQKQKVLGATIAENGKQVEKLQQQMVGAANAEKAIVEQQIAKLVQLNQTHQAQITTIEATKTALIAKGAAAAATTDSEKLAIQLVNQNRQIELSIIRDTEKAINAVKDTAARAAEQQAAALDKINTKQLANAQVLDAYKAKLVDIQQQRAKASADAQSELDVEAEAVRKLIVAEERKTLTLSEQAGKIEDQGKIAQASSDAEVEHIQKEAAERLALITVIQGEAKAHEAVVRSVQQAQEAKKSEEAADRESHEQRKTQLADLQREQQRLTALINNEKQVVGDLQQKRDQASGEQQKNYEQQAENLKKQIAQWEDEILVIDKKAIAIKEADDVAIAASNAEITLAHEEADANRNVVDSTLAISKAQRSVKEATDDCSSSVAQLFSQFAGALGIATGIGAIVQVFRELGNVIQADADIAQQALDTLQKFRDIASGVFDTIKPLYNEMGAAGDPALQATLKADVESVSYQNLSLKPSLIAATGASLAPFARKYGIEPGTDQYRSLLTAGSIAADNGLTQQSIADYAFTNLGANATGADLNQGLASVVGAAGTPALANNLLSAWSSDKAIAQGVGMGFTDFEKLYTHLRQNKNLSPMELPEIARQFVNSSSRLRGLTIDEKEQDAQKLEEGGLGQLAQFIMGSGQGPIDIQKFADLTRNLTPAQQDIVDRAIAGPRGTTAIGAGLGWQTETLSGGNPLAAQSSADAQVAADKERSDWFATEEQPTTVGTTRYTSDVEKEAGYLQSHPDLYPTGANPGSTFYNLTKYYANVYDKQVEQANVQGMLFIQYAQLAADMDSGKIKASQKDRDEVQKYLDTLGQHIGATGGGEVIGPGQNPGQYDPLIALRTGTATSTTGVKYDRASVLRGLTSPMAIHQFLRNTINYESYPTPTSDDMKNIGASENALPRLQGGPLGPPAPTPPVPATQPTTPVSINYHVRQVNYGYSADEISSPSALPNLYG